jgi:hypothetical protein
MKAVAVAGKQTQTTAAVETPAPVPGKSTLTATEPAPLAQDPRGPKGDKGEKGDKGDKGDPGIDLTRWGEFTERYDAAILAWHHIADGMSQAIDSIYTQAKKPRLPAIDEELMMTLAVAGLGGLVGLAGGLIAARVAAESTQLLMPAISAQRVGTRIVRTLGEASGPIIDDVGIRALSKSTETWAKHLADAGKDAFKDSVKLNARSTIATLLGGGKAAGMNAMDAFFEGQKKVVLDSAKKAQRAVLDLRTETFMSAADPIVAAQAQEIAMNELYEEIVDATKTEVLLKWLSLQAQSATGGASKDCLRTAQMDQLPPGKVSGVIYVDVREMDGELIVVRGHLPGTTEAMLARLRDQPIWALYLPVVYRVMSPGAVGEPGGSNGGGFEFHIRVDERSRLSVVGAISSHHKNFLGGLSGSKPIKKDFWGTTWSDDAINVGASTINVRLRDKTLADLKVEPSHG